MKILLFGGSGQLGYEINTRADDLNFQVVSPVTSEVNISEGEQVLALAKKLTPSVIINCAAYTAVDKAEEEREKAHLINCVGAENVANAALVIGARMIHLSTDYVFNGEFSAPISEDVQTDPINVYGETKLAGEQKIAQILGPRVLVVRTSSLHGQRGGEFRTYDA